MTSPIDASDDLKTRQQTKGNALIDNESTNHDRGPRFQDGLAVRRDVMAAEYVERAFDTVENTDSAALQDFVTDTVWGGVWTRPGLDYRSRSLLNLGILIALRAHEELGGHVRGALRNGLTRTEITETVIHTAGYCGAPAALAAMRVVQKVLDAELGPLGSETTGRP